MTHTDSLKTLFPNEQSTIFCDLFLNRFKETKTTNEIIERFSELSEYVKRREEGVSPCTKNRLMFELDTFLFLLLKKINEVSFVAEEILKKEIEDQLDLFKEMKKKAAEKNQQLLFANYAEADKKQRELIEEEEQRYQEKRASQQQTNNADIKISGYFLKLANEFVNSNFTDEQMEEKLNYIVRRTDSEETWAGPLTREQYDHVTVGAVQCKEKNGEQLALSLAHICECNPHLSKDHYESTIQNGIKFSSTSLQESESEEEATIGKAFNMK